MFRSSWTAAVLTATALGFAAAAAGPAAAGIGALRQSQEAKEHDLFYLAALENNL